MEHLHSLEFPLINWLQQIRSPAVDAFFKFLNFFDTAPFIFILISAVWVGLSHKEGLKLFYIIGLSGLVNILLKHWFLLPRPFHIDPQLAVIQVTGYGFPSGAAQTTIFLAGILLSFWRNKWTWIIALNFIFWISLSRIYLGLHFPSDILAGWVVGGLLLLTYLFVFPAIEKYLDNKPAWVSLAWSLAVPLSILLFTSRKGVVTIIAAAIGAGIGLFLSSTKKQFLDFPSTWTECALRMAWGIIGTFTVHSFGGLFPLPDLPGLFIQNCLTGLWLSFIANASWKNLFQQYCKPQLEH